MWYYSYIKVIKSIRLLRFKSYQTTSNGGYRSILVIFVLLVCLFWATGAFLLLSDGDRAANLDLCLVPMAFRSTSSFTCHTYCDTGPPFLRSYPKNPWFSLLNAVLLAKEQSLPILNVLDLTRPAWALLKLTTSRMLSESTTTRRQQTVHITVQIVLMIAI
jgi:hypothetical protein